jgi:alkylated DNA nucleotide flippase Atl1/uncharacterized protein YndB with AHSA1/START domain
VVKNPGAGNYARIYAVVRRIPKGKVATYGQVAVIAGLPGHARQVGYALNAMPSEAIAPWHRVINAQGGISLRAVPGYEFLQRGLLEAEGVRFGPNGRVSLAKFGWDPDARRKNPAVRTTSKKGSTMPGQLGSPESNRISDAVVKEKTGKTWAQWFRVLDRAGAEKKTHKEIVAWIRERNPEVNAWWQQMLTTGYEQNRGLRDKHEKPAGYEISGNRTIAAPVSAVFKAWKDRRVRNRWLPDGEIEIRKATANKSMRITWSDGTSDVSVNFYSKGRGKTQVSVQHGKLTSATKAARMKTFWSGKLDGLKDLLEG